MSEKKFQDLVLELFAAKNAHAVNMEPATTNPGIPDINWCMEGIEGNLELKFAHENGAVPLIRPLQLVWFRERIKAGGYPMLAYYIEGKEYSDEVFLFQGRYIDHLATTKDLDDLCDVPYLKVLNPDEIVEALISEMASWHDELHPVIVRLN